MTCCTITAFRFRRVCSSRDRKCQAEGVPAFEQSRAADSRRSPALASSGEHREPPPRHPSLAGSIPGDSASRPPWQFEKRYVRRLLPAPRSPRRGQGGRPILLILPHAGRARALTPTRRHFSYVAITTRVSVVPTTVNQTREATNHHHELTSRWWSQWLWTVEPGWVPHPETSEISA